MYSDGGGAATWLLWDLLLLTRFVAVVVVEWWIVKFQLGKGSLLDLFGRVTNRDKTMLQERTMNFSFGFFCVRDDGNGQKRGQTRRL